MRILVFLGLVLLFSGMVAAESLFSQNVQDSYKGDIEGKEFTVSINEGRVSVKYGTFGGIFADGECKEQDNIRICVSEVDDFSATVTMDRKQGSLEISKKFADDVVKSKPVKVEVTLKNIGNAMAAGIHYEDTANGLTITSPSGCDYINGKIVWDGSLNVNSEHKCSYNVRSDVAGTFKILGVATFGGDEIKKDLTFDIPEDIGIGLSVDSDMLFVGDSIRVDLTLNSEAGLSLNNLEVIIPSGLRVVSTDLQNENGKYGLFDKVVLSSTSKAYYLELVADKEGTYEIQAKGTYSDGSISESADLEVSGVDMGFSTKISDDKVSLLVENPFNEQINDLQVTSISVLKELSKESNVVVGAKNIEYVFKDVPITNALASMTYSLTVNYKSSKGEGSQQLKLQFDKDIGAANVVEDVIAENVTVTDIINQDVVPEIKNKSYSIAIGVTVLVIVIIAGIVFWFKKRKKN